MTYLMFEIAIFLSLFSVALLLTLGRRAKTFLACFIVGWIFFYDYINYHLSLKLGFEVISTKLFLEILIIVASLLVVCGVRLRVSDINSICLSLFVVTFVLIVGISNEYSLRMIYVDFRSILLPVLACVILSTTKFFEKINVRVVIGFSLFVLMVNGGLSVWDYMNFDGDYKAYWRYQSLLASKSELYQAYNESQLVYQMVRDENLRSSGFIVSALTASYLYAFAAVSLLWHLLTFKKVSFIGSLFAFLSLLAFIYVTQVRSGFVMVFFGFLMILLYKVVVSDLIKKLYLFIVPGIAFLVMLVYLLHGSGAGIDSSSLGRLDQYQLFITEFVLLGQGLGSFPGMFDSLLVYVFLEAGVVAFLIFYIIFKHLNHGERGRPSKYSDLIYLQMSVFLFLATFQHVAGSAYYFLFIFYLTLIGRSTAFVVSEGRQYGSNV